MTMEDKQFYLSAELTCRLAAIDIGSNSVRLLVAEAAARRSVSHFG